jgi:GNAT superfamily N-acetyltransferase
VLGFVGLAPGEVSLLFVRPEAAGAGLGRRLMNIALDKAPCGHDGTLKVVATLNARRFYERLGFLAVGASHFERGEPPMRYEVVDMQFDPNMAARRPPEPR